MGKIRLFILGAVLLIGLIVTGCVEYSGGYGYRDHPERPWWEHRDVGGPSEHASHGRD